jgi:hypothetical protein
MEKSPVALALLRINPSVKIEWNIRCEKDIAAISSDRQKHEYFKFDLPYWTDRGKYIT